MIAFAAAVFFLIVTPGPGVLSAAGVGSAYGAAAGLRYVAGLFIGTNLVALAVVSGLAAVLFEAPWLRGLLFLASTAYLLWLAWSIASAGTRLAFRSGSRRPGIGHGVALQAINPKAYAVNTALFSGFPLAYPSLAAEVLAKFVVLNAIWLPIHFGWLWLGLRLRRLDLSPRAHRAINRAMAASMLAVVALAVVAWVRAELP